MIAITFDDTLTYESVAGLIQRMEGVKKTVTSPTKMTLYFSSFGGDVSSSDLLIDYLNQEPMLWDLVAFDRLDSAAFDVYYEYKGVKRFTKSISACFHMMQISTSTREEMQSEDNLKRAKENVSDCNRAYAHLLGKIGFKSSWLKEVKQGKDVILYYKDFVKLKI